MEPLLGSVHLRLGLAALLLGGVACSAFGGSDSTGASSDAGAGSDAQGGSDDGGFTGADDAGTSVPVLDPCADAGVHRFLFVTSQTFRGDLGRAAGTSGRTVGDEKCNQAAHSAGLPGTYVAWLSTTVDHPKVLPQKGTPIVLPRQCEVVADDFIALTGSGTVPLKVAPTSTELGSTLVIPCYVWTNTNTSGTAYDQSPGANTCSEWTNAQAGSFGAIGLCTSLDAQWAAWSTLECNNDNAHLYCLQN